MHSLLVWFLQRLHKLLQSGSHALPRTCLRAVLHLYNALKGLLLSPCHGKATNEASRPPTTVTTETHCTPIQPGHPTETVRISTICASRVPDTLSANSFLSPDSGSSVSRRTPSSRAGTPEPTNLALLPIAHGPAERGRQLAGGLTADAYPSYPPSASAPDIGAAPRPRPRSLSRAASARFSARSNRSSAAVSVHSHMSRRSHLTHASHASHDRARTFIDRSPHPPPTLPAVPGSPVVAIPAHGHEPDRQQSLGIVEIGPFPTDTPPDSPVLPSGRASRTSRRSGYHVHYPDSPLESRAQTPLPEQNTAVNTPLLFSSNTNLSCSACANDRLRPHRIYPTTPKYIQWLRYAGNQQVERLESSYLVQPMTMQFASGPDLRGWTPCLHPEGSLYFYHPKRHAYTMSYLYDTETLDAAEEFYAHIEATQKEHREEFPADAECMIHIDWDEDGMERECYYYMANHDSRVLFWLNPFEAGTMLDDVDTVTEPSHIKHALEQRYWEHWEYFPHGKPVSTELLTEVAGTLVYAGYDALTSPLSTTPYDDGEIEKMLSYIRNLKHVGDVGGYAACVIGRMMGWFAENKVINFAGQPSARLNRNWTIYETSSRRSGLITTLSPLLFFAPDVHLDKLENVFVDKTINKVHWKTFISKLQDEWREFILYSTVMLSANTALLAIPTLGQDFTRNRNATQICSYISITASVGSIILGLLLVRQYRTKDRDTADDAHQHLSKHTHATRGLETLAILYSLPYAALMWSVLTFLIAFAFLFFQGTSPVTRAVLAPALAFVVGLVAWCIVNSWTEEDDWWLRNIWTLTREGVTETGEHVQAWRTLFRRREKRAPEGQQAPEEAVVSV